MTLHFDDDTGFALCERCMAHWWSERPRLGNYRAFYTRLHTQHEGNTR